MDHSLNSLNNFDFLARSFARMHAEGRPGHVFPLRAQAGGVLTRGGHTEATIDLMTLAGFKPAGVLCELTNDDGTMARAPECIEFANKHNMALVTIEDLVAYRQAHERKAS